MYLLLNNDTVIISISETLDYQPNGNAIVNNGALIIASVLFSEVCEVSTVPEYVEAVKYCYNASTQEYSINPDWSEPEPTTDEIVNTLLGVE